MLFSNIITVFMYGFQNAHNDYILLIVSAVSAMGGGDRRNQGQQAPATFAHAQTGHYHNALQTATNTLYYLIQYNGSVCDDLQ